MSPSPVNPKAGAPGTQVFLCGNSLGQIMGRSLYLQHLSQLTLEPR